MPIFAIVLHDSFLYSKAASVGKDSIFEKKNRTKYNHFKKLVETNMVKYVTTIASISSIVYSHLYHIQTELKDTLCGWVKYSEDKLNFDNQISYTALVKSHNNLMNEYENISRDYHKLSEEYKKQMNELINIKKEKSLLYNQLLEKYIDNQVSDEINSFPYNPEDYKSRVKLLEYAKLSMYEYRFKEIKFYSNFYTLKAGITYSLEDFFIVLYQLSYCNTPIEIFISGYENELIKECLSIFFYDNLFHPCNIFDSPIMLTIEPKGHELYKYLIANSV